MSNLFTAKVQQQARERAKGICEECGGLLKPGHSQVDHIKPRGLGGTGEIANARVLCTACHLKKTMDADMPSIRKGKPVKVLEVAAGVPEIARRFGIK